jgi:hypothetical protein
MQENEVDKVVQSMESLVSLSLDDHDDDMDSDKYNQINAATIQSCQTNVWISITVNKSIGNE